MYLVNSQARRLEHEIVAVPPVCMLPRRACTACTVSQRVLTLSKYSL